MALTLRGSRSVTRGQCVVSPSGSTKVMLAWGLTMLVMRRYCQTLCLPRWNLAFMRQRTLRPDTFSVPSSRTHGTRCSLLLMALFDLVSRPSSISTAVVSLAILERTCVGFPVVSWLYITTPVMPMPC